VAVLFNKQGEKLIELQGPSTNHWLVGMTECQNRIQSMIKEAIEKVGLPINLKLKSLGLSLSGCEDDETNEKLKNGLMLRFPDLSEHYYICSDTIGSIATASENGGLVIISGTGSNSLLLNPDGSVDRCGGWGYMLGDEGSGWWISHLAIKIMMDEEDNRRPSPHDISCVKKLILEYFQITDRFGLLEHCYTKFSKAHFAGLCTKISSGARQGDALCQHIFREAGRSLGELVGALLPSVSKSLLERPGGLPIICVGAVWGSFDLMKEGFIEGTQSQRGRRQSANGLRSFTLLQLTSSLAVGAAYLAAKTADVQLPCDYSVNATVFYRHS